jgi:hypothetical protein
MGDGMGSCSALAWFHERACPVGPASRRRNDQARDTGACLPSVISDNDNDLTTTVPYLR